VEAPASATDEARAATAEAARHRIKAMIGLSCEVAMKKPGEVPRSQGKAVRVRDLRKTPA
jgi:phenylacetate-CoA ligase